MSPTVTIYRKDSGEARLIYRATLTDFLDTGEWTVEKPAHSTPAPELKKALLPTAGREANRPHSSEIKADLELQAVAREEEREVESFKPDTKRAPRRRSSESKTEDASPSSIEE